MRGMPILSEFARVISGQELEDLLPRKYRNREVDNQSEESKNYHLKKAEEKRQRKAERNKR